MHFSCRDLRSAAGLLLVFVLSCGTSAVDAEVEWSTLAPGMELGKATAKMASRRGDSTITILRFEPDLWELEILTAGRNGGSGRTVKAWSEEHGLAAAINAGMYAKDHTTHLGYLRSNGHVHNPRFNKYQSVAAFAPLKPGLPRFRIFDLDAPGTSRDAILRDYASVLQNLRLIKRPGENRWSQQDETWSEAALGEDAAGRILFIFCRSPFSMYDLNRELLALDIDLVAAQHLEGGSKAQMYVGVGDVEIELVGSYETSSESNARIRVAWPVPNVLGIRPRGEAAGE